MVGRRFAATAEAKYDQKVRSLFSKYKSITNPIISNFVSSVPNKLSEAVDRVLNSCNAFSTNDFIIVNRTKLQIFINKFHLEDPAKQIFVSAHQPNLFPYGGVFKKIVLLQCLRRMIEKHDRLYAKPSFNPV